MIGGAIWDLHLGTWTELQGDTRDTTHRTLNHHDFFALLLTFQFPVPRLKPATPIEHIATLSVGGWEDLGGGVRETMSHW